MIISHRHKFIFIKTQKVAGTSVEIALSKFLGPEDVITPIVAPDDEALRRQLKFRGPQNFRVSGSDVAREALSLNAKGLGFVKEIFFRGNWPARYYNHIGASEVRAALDRETWNTYFKFTIERNPFEKAVSAFFYYGRRRVPTLQFRTFVLSGEAGRVSDFDKYSINGLPAMNYIARYERLSADLDEIAGRVGLGESLASSLNSIRTKAAAADRKPAWEFYDDNTRSVIELQFARELRYFGYAFPNASSPDRPQRVPVVHAGDNMGLRRR